MRWLQPGLVVKRWMVTSGLGLLIALLGAAIWADLQPIYWSLETIKWGLARVTQVAPPGEPKTSAHRSAISAARPERTGSPAGSTISTSIMGTVTTSK